MKNVTFVGMVNESKIFAVVSEPGDMTRYDYICIEDFDDFIFAPRVSTFRFPQRLNYFQVSGLLDDDSRQKELVELAEEHGCNVYTLMECIRTIMDLRP